MVTILGHKMSSVDSVNCDCEFRYSYYSEQNIERSSVTRGELMGMNALVIFIALIYAIIGGLFMAVAVWLFFKRINTISRFCLTWLSSGLIIIILLFIFQ